MECHIMAMNGAYKKLIQSHYCANRLLAIKRLKKLNIIYNLKGINRVKIWSPVSK